MFGKRSFVLALFAAALAAASPAKAGKGDNSIVFADPQVLDNLDPDFNSVRIGVIIAPHIWDTLIDRDPDTFEYKRLLATRWQWVDDATIDLELRQGVRFHDGAPFDADDVVETLRFVSDPADKMNDVSASTAVFFKHTLDDMTRDPQVRDQLERSDNTIDPTIRKEANAKALKRISGQAYAIPLYTLPALHAADKDLVFKAYRDEIPRPWEMSYR